MWGEFEDDLVKRSPPTSATNCYFQQESILHRTSEDEENNEQESIESLDQDPKSLILDSISRSNAFFKSQQKDDPDLTIAEKRAIAEDILKKSPSLFLSRFGKHLGKRYLEKFSELFNELDDEVEMMKESLIRERMLNKRRIKNRRFESAKRMMAEEGGYFSEECMRDRNPLLYETMVGKFKSEEETEAEKRANVANCSLSSIILQHMDLNRRRDLRKAQEDRENIEEFDEDDDVTASDENDSPEEKDENITNDYKKRQFDEFRRTMLNSFLDGKDTAFDYASVDNNPELDDLETEDRDAEEKYFDED